MALFKRSAFKKAVKDDKQAAKKKAKAQKKEARQDARATKKQARQDKREDKRDARQDKHDDMREIRQSDLKGKDKRDAKKDIRAEKKINVRDARQDKKDTVAAANAAKKQTVQAANTTKRKTLADLRVPRALNRNWNTYLRFQEGKALDVFKPTTLGHLKSILEVAQDTGARVRAIGSGHSFSSVGVTTDFFVETHGFNRYMKLTPARRQRFKQQYQSPGTKMAEFEAGIKIIDLSLALESDGMALINQGTYDGQTFWGAASTSTHGTGINRPPFPDMILSVVMVMEGGRCVRIEPRNGITQPNGWSEPGVDQLIQNDETFNAVICSMGCMGICYSVVIQTTDMYWLDEWTFMSTWDEVKAELSQPGALRETLENSDTFDILVSPVKAKHGSKVGVDFQGKYPTAVTYRRKTSQRRTIGKRTWDIVAKAFEHMGIVTGNKPAEGNFTLSQLMGRGASKIAVRNSAKNAWRGVSPDEEQSPDRRNKCYKIFPKGGKLFGGFGIEAAMPYQDAFRVMDSIIQMAEQNEVLRRPHTAPVSIRFVKGSAAYASPQYGRDTAMFEVLMAKGTKDGRTMLEDVERKLLRIDGLRMHWGLEMDVMSAADLANMYPEWQRWMRVYRNFNRGGTFNNRFTDRLGISQ